MAKPTREASITIPSNNAANGVAPNGAVQSNIPKNGGRNGRSKAATRAASSKRAQSSNSPHMSTHAAAASLDSASTHVAAISSDAAIPSDATSPSRAMSTHVATAERLAISKTYKIFIGGKFPRGESGRYYALRDSDGALLGNVCDCSRKDFRDAVVAARGAQPKWAAASSYNRGQILYRVAEMLEGRATQFVEELKQQGNNADEAKREVALAIDRLVYYAGWTDKYQAIFSSVNPVASSHFSFSMLEPTGVVALVAPDEPSLLGLVSLIAPAIAGANTCIAIASTTKPLCAITFAEVLATSDVPGGVVNILTGHRADMLPTVGSHMDINAAAYGAQSAPELLALREAGVENLKRIVEYGALDWLSDAAQSPYFILDLQETKTTWHPVGV